MHLCLLGVPCYWQAVCVIHSGSTRGFWFADGIDGEKCSSWHNYQFSFAKLSLALSKDPVCLLLWGMRFSMLSDHFSIRRQVLSGVLRKRKRFAQIALAVVVWEHDIKEEP